MDHLLSKEKEETWKLKEKGVYLFSFERSRTSQSDRSLKTEQLRRKDITEKV